MQEQRTKFVLGKVPLPWIFTRGNAADAVPRAAQNMPKAAVVHPFFCTPCSPQPMATVNTALTREEARISHAVELCVRNEWQLDDIIDSDELTDHQVRQFRLACDFRRKAQDMIQKMEAAIQASGRKA